MTRTREPGGEIIVIACIAAMAMISIAYFVGKAAPLSGDMGICLPSPNQWNISPLLGWVINSLLIGAVGIGAWAMNKGFSLVQRFDSLLPALTLVMCAANPWVSGLLTSSVILALANLICISVLLRCYRSNNATQQIFLIATILSIGSMVQYAFLFMTVAYIIGFALMKCLNLKSFMAFLMGLAAPYWVAIGLWIVPLQSFEFPTFSNLFASYTSRVGLFAGVISLSITSFVGIIAGLYSGIKLYAGNTQRRLSNLAASIIGVTCIVCMLVDFNNLVAYTDTLYLIVALQLANLFSLWDVRHASGWFLLILAAYAVQFYFML